MLALLGTIHPPCPMGVPHPQPHRFPLWAPAFSSSFPLARKVLSVISWTITTVFKRLLSFYRWPLFFSFFPFFFFYCQDLKINRNVLKELVLGGSVPVKTAGFRQINIMLLCNIHSTNNAGLTVKLPTHTRKAAFQLPSQEKSTKLKGRFFIIS